MLPKVYLWQLFVFSGRRTADLRQTSRNIGCRANTALQSGRWVLSEFFAKVYAAQLWSSKQQLQKKLAQHCWPSSKTRQMSPPILGWGVAKHWLILLRLSLNHTIGLKPRKPEATTTSPQAALVVDLPTLAAEALMYQKPWWQGHWKYACQLD